MAMIDVEPASDLFWAATLLLSSGEIGRHLKEFDCIFPGQGRKLAVKRQKLALLEGEAIVVKAFVEKIVQGAI